MKLRAAIILALLTLSSTALADDEEEARAAMRRGVAAFGRGEAEKALEEYETAKRLVPQANAPYLYAAEALVALARYPEAVANLERYLAKNPSVSDAEDVRGRIAKIKAEHYPGHVKIVVNVQDATMFVDGESRGVLASVDMQPGRHRIEARAPSYETAAQEIDVVGDRESTLVFTLREERKVEQPPPPPPPPAPEPTPWRTVGWATAGVGAATIVTAFIVDVAVLGPKIDDYRAAADRGDPSARGLRDDATTLKSISLAGYVVGGVLTAGGLGVALFAPRTKSTTALAPWTTPNSAGLVLHGAL